MEKFTFRIHLKQLMLQRAVQTGEPVTQKEVAEHTGLSLPTIGKWYNGDLDRIDADTVGNITRYLHCKLSDLISIELREED